MHLGEARDLMRPKGTRIKKKNIKRSISISLGYFFYNWYLDLANSRIPAHIS